MADLFSLILTIATAFTGIIFCLDKFVWERKRKNIAQGEALETDTEAVRTEKEPSGWITQSRSLFPVLLVVFILRSFIIEPFQIPSGSMEPTLLPGDFIIVEKYAYGLRDPIFHETLVHTGEPKRGDIAVFVDPQNPKIDLIKRIVGLPGDTIIYRNKTLYIKPACHGKDVCPKAYQVPKQYVGPTKFTELNTPLYEYKEHLGKVNHMILRDPLIPEQYLSYFQQDGAQIGEWVVPKGDYFAMGDNRDNSDDSRYWGFVPERNLVGKATFIWMSFTFKHKADSWLPHWIPTGIRFNRLGEI
ncbi:signal peptidase I [Vibrio sp. S4M6]|uniref:signal peptidase I n=1 Tax=Vibrio sinus TaxID=2946865 RepID=UPI00202A3C50|nr:signal peptidase I [Vibrio sinus]MCL9779813.1 signal peptidase I [Vibrio sinus]